MEAVFAKIVREIMEIHTPIELNGVLACEECNSRCHSHSGLYCDLPVDGLWPCATAKIFLRK